MKTWHLTKTLSGGAGQYALRLSNALRAQSVESRVLVAEGPVANGVELLKRVDSPVRRFVARAFRSASHRISLGAFHSLRGPEIYESPQPIRPGDVVHLHGMTGWIGVAGLRRLVPPGAKVFWTAHSIWVLTGGCAVYAGCDHFRNNCSACPILRSPWKRVAGRELRVKQSLKKGYDIRPIANSRWMADRIRESSLFGNADFIPIIPPIIHEAFLRPLRRIDIRRQLHLNADEFVIAMGARSVTDQFKGIEPFLEELAKDQALPSEVLVLLFGDGKVSVPKPIRTREFGTIDDPSHLAAVLSAADVFVSPSKMETFGMVLVEAQACGTPVLGFSVGGTPEAVRDGETGWLFPSGDFQGLIRCLRSLAGDAPRLLKAGDMARSWTRQMFCSDTVASQQKSVYANAKSSKSN